MNKKLASTKIVAIVVVIGISMTMGANLAYLFNESINKELAMVTAFTGINIVSVSLVLYVVGIAVGWFDKKEAKA